MNTITLYSSPAITLRISGLHQYLPTYQTAKTYYYTIIKYLSSISMRTLINFLMPKICIQQSPCVQYKSLFPCFLCIFFADWILKYSI